MSEDHSLMMGIEYAEQLDTAELAMRTHLLTLDMTDEQLMTAKLLLDEWKVMATLFLSADELLRRIDAVEGTEHWSEELLRGWRQSLERIHALAGRPRTEQ